MKSLHPRNGALRSSGGRFSHYAGRYTLDRIYRRIASSAVVGTLTRVGRARRTSHPVTRKPISVSVRRSNSKSWSSPDAFPHPQSGALKKHSHQISQQKLQRTRSRRRAREEKLQRVWEDGVLSSCSEEAPDGNLTSVESMVQHSRPTELSSSEETVSSDASSFRPLRAQRIPRPRNSGCFPFGYLPQLLCAVVLSLGNLNIGYSLAYHALAPANHLPADAPAWLLPWVQNLFNLGGLLGGLMSGIAINRGRKRPLVLCILVSTGAWLMVILAHNSSMIFGARLVAGLVAGVVSVLNQVYIAELAAPTSRGGLGVLPTCFGLAGTLLCFGLSYALPWKHISITGAAFNLPYFILVVFYLPDSPRFLVKSGKMQSAMSSLKQLGTPDQLPNIRDAKELYELNASSSLFGKSFVLPVVISAGAMFFSQFSGVDGVLTYAFDRFQDPTQLGLMANFPVVILYSVQLVSAAICFGCVDRKGRKTLLLISAASAAVAMLVLGLYVLFEDIGQSLEMHWIPISCVILYSGAFALGLGPIPWLLLGELLPGKRQGLAAALVSVCFWGSSLILTTSFANMQSTMYLSGTFWFYTIFCVFGYLFFLIVLPDLRPEATLEMIKLYFLADEQRSKSAQEQWDYEIA